MKETIALPLWILTALLTALPLSSQGLPVQDLELSGVTLVQSTEQIRGRLGAPVATHRTRDASTGEPASIAVFPQLTAYFVADEVMRLKTDDPDVSTPAGARVGDTVERVLELYAPVVPRSRSSERLELQVEGTEAWLVFHLYRNRVTAIELLLAY